LNRRKRPFLLVLTPIGTGGKLPAPTMKSAVLSPGSVH
jgi:hypothetical protein